MKMDVYTVGTLGRKSKSKENVTAGLNPHMSKTLHELLNKNSLVLSWMTVHFEIIQRDLKGLCGPKRLHSFMN